MTSPLDKLNLRPFEKRLVVGIEAEPLVTEEPADVKEISGAASKIEDAHRRATIEPEILGALHVDVDPVGGVLIRVDPSGVGPMRIMLAQSG